MRKNNKNNNRPVNRWNDADRRAFADGNRLRAQTIQGKRFGGAEVDEWDWSEDEDLTVDAEEDDFPCLCWDTWSCGRNPAERIAEEVEACWDAFACWE